jgi:tagatose 1,6-diphosphate aldolase
MSFQFLDPGELRDGDLLLRPGRHDSGNRSRGWAPAYHFNLVFAETGERIGHLDLRIGDTDHLRLYVGHIGYRVNRAFRGHRYAARAVRLVLPLARRHGMEVLWITCNPDNLASARTCELAGGTYVETIDLPPDSDLYLAGDHQKRRYRFVL